LMIHKVFRHLDIKIDIQIRSVFYSENHRTSAA